MAKQSERFASWVFSFSRRDHPQRTNFHLAGETDIEILPRVLLLLGSEFRGSIMGSIADGTVDNTTLKPENTIVRMLGGLCTIELSKYFLVATHHAGQSN